MRPKPAVVFAASSLLAGLLWGPGGAARADAPLPTLILYPRSADSTDDVRALVDLRKQLRADGQFQVLTYDPASAAMTRAAGDAHHPEWLSGPMTSDADRLALARALGASFLVTVAKADGRGKADAHLVEAAPSARFWNVFNKKSDEAARAIEQQAADALAHPASSTVNPPAPVVTAPAPVVTAPATPIPEPPTVVPPTVGPKPAPVTPPTVVEPPVPVATPPVASAPVVIPSPGALPTPVGATPGVPVLVPPAALPIPTLPGPPVVVIPAVPAALPPPAVDDLSGVMPSLNQGDGELARGNFVGAIARYRDAINGAPLSITPRLKLAQAYLQAEMRDKALDEARRALQIAPNSVPVQQFLDQLDAETGTSDGAIARYSAGVSQNPEDPTAHLELGDAYWNNSALGQAEGEYKQAQTLAPLGSPPA
ncbi:MAG: tetratricopeptide repeat protein, partial [Armatimonadota bacterium]|nr:tetratricopeptide repeat protein [Armatimonadota bacterium]